jgi:hypothetical protein
VERASTVEAGPGGPNSEEKIFSNKNLIFEYTKALEICRRRFRRNFVMRIFPKFLQAPQGFLKNIICHAMQCIRYKIYFWKVFHMYYNLICIFICTPIWTKKIIPVKSGCYIEGDRLSI